MQGSRERSDTGAMRDEPLGARSRDRQLDSERNFAPVAQHAELHGLGLVLVLRVALCRKLLAQVADTANAFAVDGSDDVAGFESALFGGRTGIHFADKNAFAVGGAEEAAELAAEIFRVDSQPRLATYHQRAVPLHGGNHGNFRHAKGEASRSPRC